MADVLPARVVLERLAVVELNLWQVPFPDVRVLVQRELAAVAEREVGVLDAPVVGVAGDAVAVGRVVGDGLELEAEAQRGVGLVRLAVGAYDGEPVLDLVARDNAVGGDGDGADELRAEGVVVLDLELEVGGAVRERHGEALLPDGVLGVGDDGGARHDGAGHGQRDVGIAGDDVPVVVVVAAASGGGRRVLGPAGGGRAACGEAAAHVLGEHVHVGQQARLEDPEVEVAVQEDGLRRRLAAGRRRHRRRLGNQPEPSNPKASLYHSTLRGGNSGGRAEQPWESWRSETAMREGALRLDLEIWQFSSK